MISRFYFFFSDYDGLFISNGPGDPENLESTIKTIAGLLGESRFKPIFGICLGHQLLSKAAGASTYKLKSVKFT